MSYYIWSTLFQTTRSTCWSWTKTGTTIFLTKGKQPWTETDVLVLSVERVKRNNRCVCVRGWLRVQVLLAI